MNMMDNVSEIDRIHNREAKQTGLTQSVPEGFSLPPKPQLPKLYKNIVNRQESVIMNNDENEIQMFAQAING